jgi:Rad52/22 family double-strand break repair protein
MTQHRELFAALAAPFHSDEIKLRAQGGRQLPYVTARTFMNRLDDVLGPENWWDDFVPLEHSVICRLTVRLPDGAVLTKCDAGGYAGLADPGDDDKSGFADAFKRAAVKFGVGRYLYRDGVPRFVRAGASDFADAQPAVAELPPVSVTVTGAPQSGAAAVPPSSASDDTSSSPRSGRALFAWTREQDQKHGHALLKHLSNWGKRHEFPPRMVDWSSEQVARGYAEACHTLRANPPVRPEPVGAVAS